MPLGLERGASCNWNLTLLRRSLASEKLCAWFTSFSLDNGTFWNQRRFAQADWELGCAARWMRTTPTWILLLRAQWQYWDTRIPGADFIHLWPWDDRCLGRRVHSELFNDSRISEV